MLLPMKAVSLPQRRDCLQTTIPLKAFRGIASEDISIRD
jgi:hypothetical protein